MATLIISVPITISYPPRLKSLSGDLIATQLKATARSGKSFHRAIKIGDGHIYRRHISGPGVVARAFYIRICDDGQAQEFLRKVRGAT